MAPQQDGPRKDPFQRPKSIDIHDQDSVEDLSDPSMSTLTRVPIAISSGLAVQHPGPPPGLHLSMLETPTLASISFATPGPERESATLLESPTLIANSPSPPPLSTTTINDEGHPSDGPWTQKHRSQTPIYAAVSIIPIVILVMVGAIFCIALRRRKQRRKEKDASQTQEIEQAKHTALTYLAPPIRGPSPALSGQHAPSSSTTSQLRPIILGPILSSSNGAYMTGMDTSDLVSIRSHHLRAADPYADANSILEPPPPPYRPSSTGPPSFVSASRESSIRVEAQPPTTSRTHLIDRALFNDPFDNISELSAPSARHGDDAMSIVSEISYQHDPVVTRSALS